MRLTHRVLKSLTGPKDQFQIARECGNGYRVQDVFSILMNLENEGVVFQAGGMWQKAEERVLRKIAQAVNDPNVTVLEAA